VPVVNVSQVTATKPSDRLMETFTRLHIAVLKLRSRLNKRLTFYKRKFQETISTLQILWIRHVIIFLLMIAKG
jgi:hypothetical protein